MLNTEKAIDESIRLVSKDRLMRHLETASGIRRDQGGEGEERMVDYILGVLGEIGAPVTVHEHDAYLSYPRSASLTLLGDAALEIVAITHSFAKSAKAGECVGPVRFLADRDFTKARGEIALVDGMASPIDVVRAGAAGVKALVFANPDWYLHNTIVSTIWGGAPIPSEKHRLPTIPVLTIGRQDGDAIKARLQSGPVTAEVKAEVDVGWYRVKLPEVRIPGQGRGDDFVLVGGHYCSWEYGATDNSTGVAALLELAKVLWHNRDALQRDVRIAWWPGHSQGRYAGSSWYADTFFTDLERNCLVYHNIDSPGVRGASEYVLRHTTAELEAFGRGIVERYTPQRAPGVHRPSRAADQSFLANGVPSCSIYSFLPMSHPDRKPWTGGCAGAWWWHTAQDTLDKADIEVLLADTRVSAAFVVGIANAEKYPYSLAAMAREFEEFLGSVDPAAATRLGLTELEGAVAELAAAASAFDAWATGEGTPSATVNAVLAKATRHLNQLIYAANNRFTHDAADVTPVLGTHKASLFPVLNAAANLGSAPAQTDDAKFAEIAVRRQANRYRYEVEATARVLRGVVAGS